MQNDDLIYALGALTITGLHSLSVSLTFYFCFLVSYISDTRQSLYLAYSFIIMLSRFMHIVANGRIFFFLMVD